MKIPALDLGKHKTVACVYTVETGGTPYCKIRTRCEAIVELIERCQPDRLVFEFAQRQVG